MKKRGFTLIELLIVVAIIAILAAIAVPNFLEAQVRSKVARVKSDQRTMSVALESYSVDHNQYPFSAVQYSWFAPKPTPPAGMADADVPGWLWSIWTTPVAYITSIPRDPFSVSGRIAGNKAAPTKLLMDDKYIYIATIQKMIDGTTRAPLTAQMKQVENAGVKWAIQTWGPSRRQMTHDGKQTVWMVGALMGVPDSAVQANYPSAYYDPSNGTQSFGFIVRSNRGIEPANSK